MTVITRIEPSVYREVMAHYPTGVAIVTALDGDSGEPLGMVVGTFSAVSMEPPLVSFMPQRTSGTYARLAGASSYCINVIAADQLDLCRTIAGRGEEKFADIAWHISEYGAPLLEDAVAHVHCRPTEQIEAGDHFIVLCAVDAMEVTRPAAPLLFLRGGYGEFAATPTAPPTAAQLTDNDLQDHGWLYFSEFPM